MSDWLRGLVSADVSLVWTDVLVREGMALIAGLLVAVAYRQLCFRSETSLTTPFLTTLVMLSVLICGITSLVGDNVAKAFSLVGALSIVRFRTVVSDTRDTAFVILAVAVGMACGSGHALVALILIVGGVLASLVWRDHRSGGALVSLNFKLTPEGETSALESWLGGTCDRVQLLSAASTRSGEVLSLEFRAIVRKGTSLSDLVSAAKAQPGVASVSVLMHP